MKDTASLDEDNIKTYATETAWKGVDWISVTQGRDKPWTVVSKVMNFGLHKVQVTS